MKQIVLLYLGVLSVFDIKYKSVPNIFLGIGVIGTFLNQIWKDEWYSWTEWLLCFLPGLFFIFSAVFTKKVGMADGIVLSILGIFLGYQQCFVVFTFSLFFLFCFCLCFLWCRKISKNTNIPYLPFLSITYLVLEYF